MELHEVMTMDDININSGSSSVQAPSQTDTTSSSSSPISTSSTATDTLSAAVAAEKNNPLSIFHQLAQPIYLNVWSKGINDAVQHAKEQILGDQTKDITSLKDLRMNAIVTAQDILNLQDSMDEIARRMNLVYQKQNTAVTDLNSAVDSFNSSVKDNTKADQDHIDTMNAATKDYNKSDKGDTATATYNTAIATYNTYVNTTRVDAYNTTKDNLTTAVSSYGATVTELNSAINDINVIRDAVGIPTLPLVTDTGPSVPSQATMPSAPSSSNAVVLADATVPAKISSTAAPSTPPTGQELFAQYALPVVEALIPSTDLLTTFMDNLTQYRDYQNFYLGPLAGKISTLPNSYVDQAAQVYLDESVSVGSGAGVSLASMISGLSSSNLNRVLSNSIANDSAQKNNIPLSPQVIDQIRLINIALLSRAGLGSSIPAFSLLSERMAYMDENSPAVKIALSLAFSIQISALSSSQDVQEAILKQLQAANPSAAPEDLINLAASLTAASNLSFALFAVAQIAQSLNFPELTGQTVGLVDVPATATALNSASTTTLGDVLNNPMSLSHIKEDLANTLTGYGNLSQSAANDITKTLQLKDITSESQLKDSIIQQYTQAGISSSDAIKLANRAAEFTRSEVNGANVLDTAIQNELIQKDYLTKQLQNNGVSADIIEKVVPDITSGSFTSRRELRDEISKLLVGSGSTSDQALNIATNIINPNPEALPYDQATDSQLAEAVSTRVTNQTSADLGGPLSQQLASLIVDALYGTDQTRPLSLINIIRTSLNELKGIEDVHMADTMLAFTKLSYDLFHFIQKIMDPANTLIFSEWTGIMYSSKIKHTASIDIIA